MPFIPSFPENHGLHHVFMRFKPGMRQLLEMHDVFLRDPSPLSIGERELIAGYVSGLNACEFCYDAHTIAAETFDIEPGLLKDLIDDVDNAAVDEKFKPILRYVKKLTLTPAKMTQSDAQTVLDAGWDEQALYDAVMVCALFSFMNRMVDGMGVKLAGQDDNFKKMPKEQRQKIRYVDLAKQIDLV